MIPEAYRLNFQLVRSIISVSPLHFFAGVKWRANGRRTHFLGPGLIHMAREDPRCWIDIEEVFPPYAVETA